MIYERFARYLLFLRVGESYVSYLTSPEVLSSSEAWVLGVERLGYFKASSCSFLKSVSFATKPLWVLRATMADCGELKLISCQKFGGHIKRYSTKTFS